MLLLSNIETRGSLDRGSFQALRPLPNCRYLLVHISPNLRGSTIPQRPGNDFSINKINFIFISFYSVLPVGSTSSNIDQHHHSTPWCSLFVCKYVCICTCISLPNYCSCRTHGANYHLLYFLLLISFFLNRAGGILFCWYCSFFIL